MKFTTALFVPLFAATSVFAHGRVATVNIAGKSYQGLKAPTVLRQSPNPEPILGATNPSLACGAGSVRGSLVADAKPGDVVTFNWRGNGDTPWIHRVGPMLTYMASCGSQSCDKFETKAAKWFKIDQVGKKPGSDEWYQADLMNGGVGKATIPKNLAPGNYLIRHEIIAQHLAVIKGGSEYFAACAQLRVGGNGSAHPKPQDLVTFPGAYTDTEPGILTPDIFEPGSKIPFPGPAIASLVTGGAPPAPAPPTTPSAPPKGQAPPKVDVPANAAPIPSLPADAPAQASGKPRKCPNKKRSAKAIVAARALEPKLSARRRHAARLSRRAIFGESH